MQNISQHFPSFEQLLSLINQLSDADKHRLSEELNKAIQSTSAQLTEVDNPRSLLALLRSWDSLDEDFPDILVKNDGSQGRRGLTTPRSHSDHNYWIF
ncbi:MAG: hypothetical protein KME60_05340 [Cyanomargarita calcarea GSE-NOS-MK-12-04C]|jgi:hypothetical protein|uniref:Uncharacterized protein n=1 Tax=Cyanomargarita calcarea GSE-NOS-MK-12-04C TaxID=2839659 RepID=A0A951UQX1_9CYAN|nr:hypothetical protein [Cyanomargarita calcarea GSE-NOS-MK-12-04C]